MSGRGEVAAKEGERRICHGHMSMLRCAEVGWWRVEEECEGGGGWSRRGWEGEEEECVMVECVWEGSYLTSMFGWEDERE